MQKQSRGFTRIEIIVVASLMVVMSGFLFLTMSSHKQEMRDAERKFALAQLQLALELYANDHDKTYPQYAGASAKENYQALEQDLVPRYIKYLPKDPLDTEPHVFGYAAKTGQETGYELNAALEAKSDTTSRNTEDNGNEDGVYEVGTDLTLINASNH